MAKNKQKILSIVLAGGEGTRLMPLTRDRAKPRCHLAACTVLSISRYRTW